MNLIVESIEYRNGLLDIKFEYEKDENPRFELTDVLKFGIVYSKQKADYIFDEIIPNINENRLTISLSDSVRDFFVSTDIKLAQLYIESTKEIFNEDSEEDDTETTYETYRFYLKNNNMAQGYFCNISPVNRLYFSKVGLLSIDSNKNPIAQNEEIIYLNEDEYSLDNGVLSVRIPFDEENVEKCEVLYARVSEYNNVYTDIIENYVSRYNANIENETVKVSLLNINENNILNSWLSVQFLFSIKGQKNKTRVLIGEKTYKNGHSLYDLRERGYEVKTIAKSGNCSVMQSDCNIGLIFAINDKSYLRFPLCSARLIDSQLVCDNVTLLIQCREKMGEFNGIVIEDSMGEKAFIEKDSIVDRLMLVSINTNSFNRELMAGDYKLYAVSEKDDCKWMLPVVVKDTDEKQFKKIQLVNELGCKVVLKLGVENELVINSRVSNPLILENKFNPNPDKQFFEELERFPKNKGELFANITVLDKGLNIYPNDLSICKYVKDIKIVIRPSNPIEPNDYLLIDRIEKISGGYSFKFDNEDLEYIGNNKISRFFVYLKTDFYEYFLSLMGINKKHYVDTKSFFDRRNYFLESVDSYELENIEYEIQPYYSYDGQLSIRSVRTEDKFKGQMSTRIEDVSINDGILRVDGTANKLYVGQYSGLCISYRNRTEEDAVKIISNDITVVENEENVSLTAFLDVKELPDDGATWDILIVYTLDGKDYFLNMFQNGDTLRNKYRDPYNKDEYVFGDGTVVFPYCTFGRTVALLRREYYEKYDTVEFRLQEVKAIEEYKAKKDYYDSMNIVLIFEKFGTCSDNAYHFFKYCMDHNCEKKIKGHIYYIIGKDSIDYHNVSMYEDHLLEFGSIQHQIYLLAARLLVSSDTNLHSYVYRVKDSYIAEITRKKKYIFIDHGIAALKNGSYIYGKGKQGEPTWYTLTSDFQKGLIKKYYKLSDEQLKVTGLARWDALEDRSNGKKKILIAPTWRRSLEDVSDEKFLQSSFCQNYIKLLTSPRFEQMLEKYDLECDFYMHLKFIDYLDVLKGDNSNHEMSPRINICSFGDKAINNLYMECSMMITDYSSVAFDTLWQNKPVVFFQFDIDDFDEMWGSMIDMEKDLPGDRVDNLDSLLDVVEDYVVNDFCMKKCYISNANKFFKYKDHNNCQRIWKVVESVWKKVSYKAPKKPSNAVSKPYVNPYLVAASEGRVGLKTILLMIPRWFSYKVKKK